MVTVELSIMDNTMPIRLLWLLQLSDTALPIGALNHSCGLETLAAEEWLSADELQSFLHDYLHEVHETTRIKDTNSHEMLLVLLRVIKKGHVTLFLELQNDFIDRDLSSLRRSEMFIDRYLRRPTRGSEGRNETRLVLVKLSSAPPNRAGGSRSFRL